MISESDARDFAAELCAAELDGSSAELPTKRFPHFDWSDARRIARKRDALRRADGDEQIGYKLGWTSSAMRDALGIDQPNWGTLWRSQQCDGGSPAVAVAWLVHQLHGEGQRLRAGEIVYTGGLTAPFDVTGESKLTAQCPDLGNVQLTISRNSEGAPDGPNDSPSPRRKW